MLFLPYAQKEENSPHTTPSRVLARKKHARKLLRSTAMGCTFSSLALLPSIAAAAPQGGSVAHGSADIIQSGKLTTINQSTDRAVLDWQKFNLSVDESAKFIQPSSQSVTVNRVHDVSASTIAGKLSANGHVVITNPNGVMFTDTARVDVGGLTVSTATATDADAAAFVAGKRNDLPLSVAGNIGATIVNHGNITAKEAGLVGLVAPRVENSGIIRATKGRVQLASGDTATLDLYGDGLVSIAVTQSTEQQLIHQRGLIEADGGTVLLSAAAGQTVANGIIKMDGVIQARSIENKEGKIILQASGSNGTAKTGNSSITISGKLDTSGTTPTAKGGKITVTADQVKLASTATIDVSGTKGGGSIKIGGDYQGKGTTQRAKTVEMEKGATIHADAIQSGNGGEVILWSDDTTSFHGTIFARGGASSGNGGFIETSGKENLRATGYVDLSAAKGSFGTWLLDPANITIYGRNHAGATNNDSSFLTSYLEAQLSNIELIADNSITFDFQGDTLTLGANRNFYVNAQGNLQNNIITASSGSIVTQGTGTITLDASTAAGNAGINFGHNFNLTTLGSGNILLKANNTINIAAASNFTTNGGSITFNADADGSTAGAIRFSAAGSVLTSNGGAITLGGGLNPLTGYARSALQNNASLLLSNTILDARGTSNGGTITLSGQGFDNTGGTSNYGVHISNGSILRTSHNGAISINGIGGSTTANGNHGIYLDASSNQLLTASGNITLNGNTTSAGADNYGIAINGGSITTTNPAGSINLNATNNETTTGGIYFSGPTAANITAGNEINYITNRLKIESGTPGPASTAGGRINVRPNTSAVTIGIGNAPGTLNISKAFLDGIVSTPVLSLGGSGSWNVAGKVSLDLVHDFTGIANTVHIYSASQGIASANAGSLTARNITLQTAGDINFAHDFDLNGGVGGLLLLAYGNISYSGGGDITTTGSTITLNSDRDGVNGGAIYLGSGTELRSNGGNITLGGGADPLTGYARGSSTTYASGIFLDNALIDASGTSIGGTITMNGSGWALGTYSDSIDRINEQHGIVFRNASTVQTNNNGGITLNGLGSGTGAGRGFGILLDNGANTIQAHHGDIALTGSGRSRQAVTLSSSGANKVEATGTGNLSILGNNTSGNSLIVSNSGTGGFRSNSGNITVTSTNNQIESVAGGSGIFASSVSGTITLIANALAFSSNSKIQTGGDIIVRPYTAGYGVSVGENVAGTLNISNDFLSRLIWGSALWLGGYGLNPLTPGYVNNAGAMTIQTTTSLAGNVNFLSGGDIVTGDAGELTFTGSANAILWALGNISFTHDLDLTAAGSGNIRLNANGNIVYSGSGDITTNGGTITLNSDRDGVNGGAISLGVGTELHSNGGNITLGGGANPLTTAAIGAATYAQGLNLTSVIIDAGGGNISLHGQGHANTSSYAAGININDSTIQTSGNGTLSVTGIGGSTGAAGYGRGVSLIEGSSLITEGGSLTVRGIGGAGGNGTSNSNSNLGILLSSVGVNKIQSTSGAITITGTGGGSGGSAYNSGVIINSVGGGGILSSGGPVTITGTEGIGSNSFGIQFGSGGITIGGTSSGNITLITNSLIGGSNAIIRSASDIIIRPRTAGYGVSVGNDVTDTLNISNDLLSRLTWGGKLWIGGYGLAPTDAGYIQSAGAMTVATTHSFAGDVIFSAAGDLSTTTTLRASGAAGITLFTPGGTLAVNGIAMGSGDLTFIADSVAHSGGSPIDGTGNVYIRPYDLNRRIHIRGQSSTDALYLNLPATRLTGNWNNVTIGHEALQGHITIGTVEWLLDVTFLSGSGNIFFENTIARTLAANKSITITTGTGNIATFSNTTGGSVTTSGTGSINLNSGGNIIFDRDFDLIATGSGSIRLNADGNIIYSGGGDITTNSGNIILNADLQGINAGGITLGTGTELRSSSGNISLIGTTTLTGAQEINSGTGLITVGAINAGSHNLTLTADDLAITGALTGSGILTLQPYSTDRAMSIGAGNSGFQLSTAEIAYLQEGWNKINLGRADSINGAYIDVYASTWNDPITFRGHTVRARGVVGGLGGGNIKGLGDASFTFAPARLTSLHEAVQITTQGQDVTFDTLRLLHAGNSITTQGGKVTIGNIQFEANANGAHQLTTTSGNGDILINGTIGNLAGNNFTNQSVSFNAGTGSLLFGNTLDGQFNLTGSAQNISFNGAWGNSTPLGNISLTSVNSLTLPKITTANLDVTVTGAGNSISTLLGSKLTLSGAGAMTLTSDDLILGDELIGPGGTLTLQQYSLTQGIDVARSVTGDRYNLSTNEIALLRDGWNLINIGRENSSATHMNIGTSTWYDPVNFRGRTTRLYGTITGLDDASISLTASDRAEMHGATVITQGNDFTTNRALSIYNSGNGSSITTNGGAVTIGSGLTLSNAPSDSLQINTNNGNISIGGTIVNTNSQLRTLALNAGSGAISFGGSSNGLIDLTANAGSMSFNGAWGDTTALGNISLTSVNSLTLPKITAANLNVSVTGAGNRITVGNNAPLALTGDGNLTLTADDVDILSDISSTGGTLTLQPYAANRAVNLGFSTGDFYLGTSDFAKLKNGWANILIGRTDSTEQMNIGTVAFIDPVTFRTGSERIQIRGELSGTDNANFAFTGSVDSRTNFFNTVTTANGSVNVGTHSNVASGGIYTHGGNITLQTISSPVDSNNVFTMNSGGGNITLGNLSSSTHGKLYNLDAGSGVLKFTSSLNGVSLNANAASILFANAWGTTTALGNVSLTSVNSLTLPKITAANIDVTVTGAGNSITTLLGSKLTLTGTGAMTLTADDLILGDELIGLGGTLALQPYALTRQIGIGTDITQNRLHLSKAETALLKDGWSQITLGRSDTEAWYYLGESETNISFSDNLLLRQSGIGGVAWTISQLNMTDKASVTAQEKLDLRGVLHTDGGDVKLTSGRLLVNNGSIITNGGNFIAPVVYSYNNSRDFTVNTSNGLNPAGNITINSINRTGDVGLETARNFILNAGNTGVITFIDTVNTNANITANAGSFTFGGAWGNSITPGNISLTSANSITLPKITAANLDVTVTGAGNKITVGSGAPLTLVGSGNMTLTSDDIDILSELSSTGGTLRLQPYANDRIIRVNSNNGDYNLSTSDINYIQNGWGNIFVGKLTNTGEMYISNSQWQDPITFLNNSRIELQGTIIGTGDASVNFNAGSGHFTSNANLSITTAGQDITFKNTSGPFGYTKNISLNSNNGNITFDLAGNAAIYLANTSGVTANTSGVTANTSLNFNAGSGKITLPAIKNGNQSSFVPHITMNAGSFDFNGAWGIDNSSLALGNVSITSANSLTLPKIRAANIDVTVTGASNKITMLAGNKLTLSGPGNLTLTANDLVLGDELTGPGGILTLQPYSLNHIMRINHGTDDGSVLHLNTTELGYLTDGWSMIQLGRANATSNYLYIGTSNWKDPVTFRGWRAVITNAITASANTPIIFNAVNQNEIYASGSVTTQNSDIDFLTRLALFNPNTVRTINSQGGNINFHSIHGSYADTGLRVLSGGGDITISGAINQTDAATLKTLIFNAGSGTLTFGDTVDGNFNLTADAATLSLNGAWGSAVALNNIVLQSSNNNITLPAMTANGTIHVDAGSANIRTNGTLRSMATGNAITLLADTFTTITNGKLQTPNGRWLIYTDEVAGNSASSLTNDFRRYSCEYAGACPSIPAAGNGVLFRETPILTVTAAGHEAIYGNAANLNGYNYTVSGYYTGDATRDRLTGSLNGSTSYAAGNNVGYYNINHASGALLSAMGYDVVYANNSTGLRITPRALTAGLTGTVSKTYDGNALAALSSGNFLLTGRYGSDDVSLDLANLLASYGTKNAGTGITVTAQQLGLKGSKASNYTVNTTASSVIGSIARALLNVIALPGSKTYGTIDPTLSYTYSGLVGGESSASFAGILLRQSGEQVNSYQINQGTLAATGNYSIGSFTPATLNIYKAPLWIQISNAGTLLGTEFPIFSASYNGLKLNDTESVVHGLELYTDATAASPSGQYSIYGKGATAANYSINYLPATFTIYSATVNLPTTVEQSRITQTISRTERAINNGPTLIISTPVPPASAPSQKASNNTEPQSSSSTDTGANENYALRTMQNASYNQNPFGEASGLVRYTMALKRILAIQ